MAIRAKVVVDATGDGDMFVRAGAAFDNDIEEPDIHHCMNTAWLGRRRYDRWIAFKTAERGVLRLHGARARRVRPVRAAVRVLAQRRGAVHGTAADPGYSAVDVEHLTEVEIRSHRRVRQMLELYRREMPGFERRLAHRHPPQIGTRHSRRLVGVDEDDARGVDHEACAPTRSASPLRRCPLVPERLHPPGCLVPAMLDGLLAAGRNLSSDTATHSFMREIPQCWAMGQAAGVAAAVAVAQGVEPRAVDIARVQQALRAQGVYLRQTEAALTAA